MSNMADALSAFNLKIDLLAGANADTNIAVVGIEVGDLIIWCGHITTAAAIATMADITSEVVVLTDGNIQLTTTATGSDQLFLFWSDLSA